MRAVALDAVPAAPQVTEVDEPRPGTGEVLVLVATSSLNGFDAATAAGHLQGMMEHTFPLVIGKDFAGTIAELGEGVTEFAVGDEVFGVVMKPSLGAGSLGEYVSVPTAVGLARIPAGLEATEAGALGLAGTAALNAVDAVAPTDGETVLICGATGGVGAIAVQYALARGARVIATARPGAEADFVNDLSGGKAVLVDYTGDLAAQVKELAPEGVAAALHLAGDGSAIADLVADGGRLASTLGLSAEALPGRNLTVVPVMAYPDHATLDRLAADAATGVLRVPVTATYPLERAPQAFADFVSGAVGKLAITLP
ncbi:NADPH:quinone reductase-like Zn-dependent oxidoreductase [Actinocorallia herbida]|uniref:NADPH:quinone reductase-like Zn-dependent oxidoreductase n=1 Tax=Actinocorallia herbida TaxID=58109 RepID=A0A3N1D4J2_9ACTN|nr:NADP-dependent oxidoreductase [Actinocorallia herbida]ROO88008.1 NADPH:quinone reductase-like Zn-dependent oxidoreductase [Actinocorallia herbida]